VAIVSESLQARGSGLLDEFKLVLHRCLRNLCSASEKHDAALNGLS
jgi:hypothetical protein